MRRVFFPLISFLALCIIPASALANDCPLQDAFAGGGRGPSSGPREWYVGAQTQAALPGNPLSGRDWFVDCQWGEAWTHSRIADPDTQKRLQVIRDQPIAKWFGPTREGVYTTISNFINRVQSQAPGAMPLLVWSKMESGYCNPRGYKPPDPQIYSSSVYRENVREMIRALRDNPLPLTMIVEPDELASLGCLPGHAKHSRLARISYVVDQLSQLPWIQAYVDAGASDWMGWKSMIRYLRAVGVAKIRGFALNVTHYDWTLDNVAYGQQMASRLGKHFVVNTARNGNGPITPALRAAGYEGGCNIPNAGLGVQPTVVTKQKYVDAYLWILNPGFSDGPCRHGKNYRTDRVRWDTPLALKLIRGRSERLRGTKITYHS